MEQGQPGQEDAQEEETCEAEEGHFAQKDASLRGTAGPFTASGGKDWGCVTLLPLSPLSLSRMQDPLFTVFVGIVLIWHTYLLRTFRDRIHALEANLPQIPA